MTAPDAAAPDWRHALLAGSIALPSSPTVRCVVGRIGDTETVIAAWDFTSHGGSFGEADADAFVAATSHAIAKRLPLVTLLRSGGTRLPEGMRALVGIPRTTLALQRLRAAELPHISIADHPTMGGVWVSIGSHADLRFAVTDALIGFSGPRVVTAMTGRDLAIGSNTAQAAYDAGLVDALLAPADVASALGRALATLTDEDPIPVTSGSGPPPEPRDGWEQVIASRTSDRPDGVHLLDQLLVDAVELRAADSTVAARVGRLAGRRTVGVALAATRGTMPTPAGFTLLARAAALAGSLDLALVVLVDTPGADPHTESLGLSGAIADAMTAVLGTAAPTVSLVHGEGGSGGALAGAVTDVVGVGPSGWFAALGPEGAAATLRIEPAAAARLMQITPADLLSEGFADAYVPSGLESAWLASTLDRLRDVPVAVRLGRRHGRWSAGLPGRS
jgi:acetyl-CoA carboxylase carboxyltransferase component